MSFLKNLKNAKNAVAKQFEKALELAPEEIAHERMAICKECPSLGKLNRCKECGCFMDAKTKLAITECPLGKWSKFS